MPNHAILNLIGHTPLVPYESSSEGAFGSILMKLEYMNPSGSTKDRMAYRMVTDAIASGALKPGDSVVEASTGNAGIALSFVCSVLGIPLVIYETIPGRMGELKRKLLKNYGVEAHLLPTRPKAAGGEAGAGEPESAYPGRRYCLELEKNQGHCWWARQFSNPSNPLAHRQTGREILEQTHGKVDTFVASIGSGGTLKGIAEALREANPNVRIVGVHPHRDRSLVRPDGRCLRNEVEGGILADLLETPKLVDELVEVGDPEAVAMTRRLRRDGFTCGNSSGANVLVALQEARTRGGTVVTVLPDHSDRYDAVGDEHYTT